MPRPRRDGTPATAPNKRKLSDIFLKKLKPQARPFVVWDTQQRGLAVAVQPTGHKSWKCVYSLNGRPRWYSIGDVAAIGLSTPASSRAASCSQWPRARTPLPSA